MHTPSLTFLPPHPPAASVLCPLNPCSPPRMLFPTPASCPRTLLPPPTQTVCYPPPPTSTSPHLPLPLLPAPSQDCCHHTPPCSSPTGMLIPTSAGFCHIPPCGFFNPPPPPSSSPHLPLPLLPLMRQLKLQRLATQICHLRRPCDDVSVYDMKHAQSMKHA